MLLLLSLLVVLQGLLRQVAVLVSRWSGVVRLVPQVGVGVVLDVKRLVEHECEDLRTCTLPRRRCGVGGPGPSRHCSRDTSNESA